MTTETIAAPTVHWALMPVLECFEFTQQAVLDILAQTVPTRVLIIDQGSSKATNDRLRQLAEEHAPRVLLWSFNPALSSLSAAWNRGLDFVWEQDGTAALVINNDTRCWQHTYEMLLKVQQETDALFVTPVGVREAQFQAWLATNPEATVDATGRGGPDYSFYLITREGHDLYRFDERFIPAFFEDLDSHRRYMLGGDGQRIFSVNIPYLHYGSQTIKSYTEEQKAKFHKANARNAAYYQAKWGGPVNAETFVVPFGGGEPVRDGACTTTPDLQRQCLADFRPDDDTRFDRRVSHAPRTGVGEPSGGSS